MTPRHRLSPETFLDDLRRVYREQGRCSETAYCQYGAYNWQWSKRLYGSWSQAVASAGLPVNQYGFRSASQRCQARQCLRCDRTFRTMLKARLCRLCKLRKG